MRSTIQHHTGLASAILASAIVAVAVAIVGSIGVRAQTPDPAGDTAWVRVLHASPDAPPVDVLADGAEILGDVPFGVISEYLEVPAGDHRIQVFAAGGDPATAGAIIDATLTLEGGSLTTVAATNEMATIEVQVISDAPTPVADQAQLRVVHLSADAPAVDLAPDGAEPIVTALAYPDATAYLTLPPGELDVEVRPTGTMDVTLQLDPLTLEAGRSYSAFAIGSVEGGTFRVLPAVDASVPEPETAMVRVLHGSPDAPPVDVLVDGVQVLADVPFGTISAYLEVPAGEHRIQVVAAGADPATAAALIDATLTFGGGTRTTVAATDVLAAIGAQVIIDAPAPTPEGAQLRVVHLAADVPAVAIARDNARRALIRTIGYPRVSRYLTLEAGRANLQLRGVGTREIVLELEPVTLAPGTSTSAFVIGSPKDGTLRVVVAQDAILTP